MRNTESFYIGGLWLAPLSEARCEVFDPSTEQPFARIALANSADVDHAVAAAKAAFPAWSVATLLGSRWNGSSKDLEWAVANRFILEIGNLMILLVTASPDLMANADATCSCTSPDLTTSEPDEVGERRAHLHIGWLELSRILLRRPVPIPGEQRWIHTADPHSLTVIGLLRR